MSTEKKLRFETLQLHVGQENPDPATDARAVLRLPIMLEWQKRIGCHDAFLALGPSVEYRWHEHSRYFIGKHKHTETGDINLNPIGLNLEARAGYSGVMLYARAGITPLLNKTKAPECYPMTIGLGFRL